MLVQSTVASIFLGILQLAGTSGSQMNKIAPYCMVTHQNNQPKVDENFRPILIPGTRQFQRKPYEDRAIRDTFQLSNGQHVYVHGVLDGHADADVVEHLSTRFTAQLYARLEEHQEVLHSRDSIIQLLFQLVLDMDKHICTHMRFKGGSTVSLVVRYHDTAYVVNLGDSKTYVFQKNNLVYKTQAHSPEYPEERRNIQLAGGRVANGRVHGLAVSRAMGDCDWKMTQDQWNERADPSSVYSSIHGLVRAYPDIHAVPLTRGKSYTFLSASDGIFDRDPKSVQRPVTDETVLAMWRKRSWSIQGKSSRKDICQRLLNEALIRKSIDDITVVAVKI